MLYLLRHGEITGSDQKRYIGQRDIPLNDKGRDQAAWWQRELAHVDFETVWSSDLIRALDTAIIVSDRPVSAIRVMPQLREICLGDWEGAAMATIRRKFPEAWAERGRQMDRFQVPHGESFQDLHDRVIPLFQNIATGASGNVLVVSHAGVNRIMLSHVLQRPIRELFSIPQGYGALNLIDYHEGKFFVLDINRTPGKNILDY